MSESNYPANTGSDTSQIGAQIAQEVQNTLQKGPIRKVRIKFGAHTIKEIPVEAAAVTAVIIGLAAFVVSQLRVEFDR